MSTNVNAITTLVKCLLAPGVVADHWGASWNDGLILVPRDAEMPLGNRVTMDVTLSAKLSRLSLALRVSRGDSLQSGSENIFVSDASIFERSRRLSSHGDSRGTQCG